MKSAAQAGCQKEQLLFSSGCYIILLGFLDVNQIHSRQLQELSIKNDIVLSWNDRYLSSRQNEQSSCASFFQHFSY